MSKNENLTLDEVRYLMLLLSSRNILDSSEQAEHRINIRRKLRKWLNHQVEQVVKPQ